MSRTGKHYTFTNRNYNATVAVGASVTFTGIFRGFTGSRPPGKPVAGGENPPEHQRMSPENEGRASRPAADPLPSPPAAGVRLPWPDLPEWLRQAIERDLGSPVVEATNQSGGFSPGTAARLVLADGGRAFVKAVGVEQNPDSPSMHRAEARVAAALPPAAPAPRLLASYDRDGWVALVYEDVEGTMPAEPWRPDELDRVLEALAELAAALTPAPLDGPSAASRLEQQFQGWRRTVAARSDGVPLDWLDPWARRNLDGLADLEAGWKPAVAGDTLLHGDLRADNLLLARDRVVVVDWPWACVGAPWLDLLLMLPSVRMQGGPDPEEVLASHPVAAGADRHAMTSALAAFAGMLTWQAHLPPPPGLPTLRAFQAAQATVALDWLHLRTAWR